MDRSAFMAAHVRGSLYAPLDKTFNTIVGSYVDDETPVYLIIDEANVNEAVRDLVRIGIDQIVGYATPEMVALLAPDAISSIEEVTYDAIENSKNDAGVLPVDVRRMTEYDALHVDGAINIAHTRLSVRKDEVPTGRKLMVHCRTGARAAAAAAFLAREGHDVAYVNDDFDNWTIAQSGQLEGVA
jgi:hydroxyacylglutathione hydrolase